jgi:MoxR-like ATPase
VQINLALCCFFAEGHLLIEDLPGMGKTTLASVLAKVLGLQFSRVQFTSDMLPSDILGSTVFEKETGLFRFHKGPVFTQLLLADEINRTTPKTQSALLEAMAERQVTIDGLTYPLVKPFFVIATQNPSSQSGTFALPESQLDRFLMRIELGYPDVKSERALLKGEAGREVMQDVKPLMEDKQLLVMQNQVKSVNASDSLLDYVQRLVHYTRQHPHLRYGISPRAALALLQAAKAWAFIHDREYVVPEDIQAVLKPVFYHRLVNAADSPSEASAIIETMQRDVAVS